MEESNIKVTKVNPDAVTALAGVPAGTDVNGEVVVEDLDENGVVVGWHKETL
jgi:hypothetical protein